jgi:excisionase family DNA binding protein
MSATPQLDAPSDRLLTVPEIAGEVGVTEETVWRWIRSGKLQAVRLGGASGYRIKRSRLEAFIAARETGGRIAQQLLDAALQPGEEPAEPARRKTREELMTEASKLRARLAEISRELSTAPNGG